MFRGPQDLWLKMEHIPKNPKDATLPSGCCMFWQPKFCSWWKHVEQLLIGVAKVLTQTGWCFISEIPVAQAMRIEPVFPGLKILVGHRIRANVSLVNIGFFSKLRYGKCDNYVELLLKECQSRGSRVRAWKKLIFSQKSVEIPGVKSPNCNSTEFFSPSYPVSHMGSNRVRKSRYLSLYTLLQVVQRWSFLFVFGNLESVGK